MTQYTNPDLTQREIVEESLAAIVAMLDNIDTIAAEATTLGGEVIDYLTAQVVAQHVSVLKGSKFQLDNERVRLANIIATWDGTAPVTGGTPTLPTTPL